MNWRIQELDETTRAALPGQARAFADLAHSTAPVDWSHWESGVQVCYRHADLLPPRTFRVPSPLALARTLWLADIDETPGDEDRAVVGLLGQVVRTRAAQQMSRAFVQAVLAQVRVGVLEPVDSVAAGDAIAAGVAQALHTRDSTEPDGIWQAAKQVAPQVASVHRGPRRRLSSRRRQRPDEWTAWQLHFAGQFDAAWTGYATVLAEATGTPNAAGWQRRVRWFAAAQTAGWWWPGLDFVLVSERPTVVRTEPNGDRPDRLHRADGPAIGWADGWQLYFWHGTRVPEWVIRNPTVAAVAAETNIEVRRCAIEAMGWDTYIARAGLRLVDTAADPGNTGSVLRLYDLPRQVWGTPGRVLLVTNGSAERDGTRRRYGLPVPVDVPDAVAAAAWTYGLRREQYARMARRT